jgi:hypothetical protein
MPAFLWNKRGVLIGHRPSLRFAIGWSRTHAL